MYTTLNILKHGDACVPGFTRMASFFGITPDVKEQRIPLHVVALVGGLSDAQWALDNAAVIEEEEFKKFYQRHLPAVFKRMMYYEIERRNRGSKTKNPILNDLIKEAFTVHTFEQIEAFLKKARSYRFDHALYNSVLNDRCWSNPHQFIHKALETLTETYTYGEQLGFPEDTFVPKDGKDPHSQRRASTTRGRSNRDDEDDYDDEDERPRRPVARRSRDDDDDWGDFERPTVSMTYRKEFGEWLKTHPHSYSTSSSSSGEMYFIRTTRRDATNGQNAAFLLCNEDDPYAFMSRMKYKVPKGIKVAPATETAPARMSISIDDPKQMFALVRVITTKSEMPDADTEE